MSTVIATDSRFDAQLDTLADQGLAQGGATLLTVQRVWNVPDPGDWSGNPLAPSEIGSAFDRTALNTAHLAAIAQGGDRDAGGNAAGTLADRMVTKIQVDYLAIMERAFRARHASPVRCACHAAARRRGHGHDQGPLKNVRAHVLALIAAGTVTS